MSPTPSGPIARLASCWDRYWFTPAPVLNLAICRIVLFLVMLWDLSRFRALVRPLGEAPAWLFKPILIIQWLGLPPPTTAVLDGVYYLLILFGIGALVGWLTKACLLAYLLLYAYWVGMWFSFGQVHHAHAIFTFFVAALLLSPCDRALALDDLVARLKSAARRGAWPSPDSEGLRSEFARWPLRLIQVMLCLVYFLSGFAKLQLNHGLEWANGSTLQFYLIYHNNEYGSLLAQNFFLCRLLSFFTLAFELGFPVVLFLPKVSWVILPTGVLFHVGSWYTMDTFFYQFIGCYVAFVNFHAIGLWLRRKCTSIFGAQRLIVIMDGGCPLCLRSAALINYFDWLGRVEFLDLLDWKRVSTMFPDLRRDQCLEQMHVVDATPRTYAGFFAFRRLARVIPLLWIAVPILYLPPIPRVGQYVYRWIARHRVRSGAVCTIDTCK